ncbi:MAG: hypothetical protein WBD07_10395 [Vicinamibacterales bacterium]
MSPEPTSIVLIVGGILAALAGALHIYQRYSGEHPILDLLYDRRIRQLDLATLDRQNAGNTRRSDLVITLTTLPSRIGRIGPTIKSLLNQTCAAREIRLNVPQMSRRERRPYVVPDWLGRLRSVTIVPCEDHGPATKLIPSVVGAQPNDRVLVVDDDRIYHPYLVEQMAALSDANPDVAIAGSGWDAPGDLIDRPTTLVATLLGRAPAPIKCTRVGRAREVDIMQGLGGYLVKPRFFDVSALADYRAAPDAAFFVDDVWISAHCRARKVVYPGRRTNFPSRRDARFYKRSSVALVNRGTGTPASRNNTIMLQFFKDRWRAH